MSSNEYANPDALVSTEWLAAHLNDANLRIVESNEDILLYDTGHIPGAVKIDWTTDLNDPLTRDYIDGAAFAALMNAKGITRDTTVVFYGDKSNWWAAYSYWVFQLFGHTNAKLLNGGRKKWVDDGRTLTREVPKHTSSGYPVVQRDDSTLRAFREQVLVHVRA